MSKPVNGVSEQSECSKAKCCVASERSEWCEQTNLASDRVAGSKRDCLSLESPPQSSQRSSTHFDKNQTDWKYIFCNYHHNRKIFHRASFFFFFFLSMIIDDCFDLWYNRFSWNFIETGQKRLYETVISDLWSVINCNLLSRDDLWFWTGLLQYD